MPVGITETGPLTPEPIGGGEKLLIAPISPRPGEQRLAEWVDSLYVEAAKAKEDEANTRSWNEWEDGFWGEGMWPDALPTFKPPIGVNKLQSNILQEVSDLTDTPTKVFVQKSPEHPERAKKVEKSFQANWRRDFLDQVVMQAALDAAVYPCGFLAVRYDPMGDQGRGKVVGYARDPKTVFNDPDAVDDEEWRYVVLHDVLDLVYIHTAWVDQGPRVRPDALYSVKLGTESEPRRGPRGLSGRYQGPVYSGGSLAISEGFAKARAGVQSVYIRDEAEDDEVIERIVEQVNDETGAKTLTKQLIGTRKRRYPHGRLIQVSNGVVLYDGVKKEPGRFPVIRVCLQPTLHRFWPPQSIVSSVLELYRAANKMDSLFVENSIRLNAGFLVAPTTSGIDPAKFAAIPGQVLLVPPGMADQIKVHYPNPMPPELVGGGQRLREYGDDVLGMRESRTGQGQRGNVSPELTETEVTQAMGLTRLRGRLLHVSVQKFVEVLFAYMATYYQVPRIIPHVQGDQWEPTTWEPILKPEDYAVYVDASSFQVKARTQMQRLYVALARLGKLTDRTLLNAMEIPNAEEEATQLEKQLQLQALAGIKKQKGRGRA